MIPRPRRRPRTTLLDLPRPRLVLSLLLLVASGCAPGEGPGGASSDALVFFGARVVDGTGAPAREGWVVVVRGDTIAEVGPSDEVRVIPGARVVDAEGLTLMPGLFDMHVHLSKARAPALPLFVVNGVTAVRDVGGDWPELRRWRAEIEAGERLGPRIRAAGPYLEAASNVERMRGLRERGEMVEPVERTRIPVGSPERARHVVDSVAALGVDLVKVRTVPSMDVYRAIARAADSVGLPLAGHVFGIPLNEVVAAGQESVEHFPYPTMDDMPEARRRAVFRLMADSGTVVVPTLVTWRFNVLAPDSVLAAVLADSAGRYEPRRRTLSAYLVADWTEQLAERVPAEGRDEAEAGAESADAPDWEAIHRSTLRNFREMHEEGVTLLPGTDVAVLNIFPGAALHDELALLVEDVGMTPMEALVAATRRSAELLGLADRVGTVEAGKRADLVLVEGNPVDDIHDTRRVSMVVRDGVLYTSERLDSIRAAVEEMPEIERVDWGVDD